MRIRSLGCKHFRLIFTGAALLLPAIAQAAGTVSGETFYDGSYDPSHTVLISAHLYPESEPVDSVLTSGVGAYALDNLDDGDYYIAAFLDIHERGEGPP